MDFPPNGYTLFENFIDIPNTYKKKLFLKGHLIHIYCLGLLRRTELVSLVAFSFKLGFKYKLQNVKRRTFSIAICCSFLKIMLYNNVTAI